MNNLVEIEKAAKMISIRHQKMKQWHDKTNDPLPVFYDTK